MMKIKYLLGMVFLVGFVSIILIAADHIDAPAVSNTSSDITDFYAFESPADNDNMVFAVAMQGLLSPGATSSAVFDEDVLTEINIDNNGDNIEDLLIQLIPRDGIMYAFGPFTANSAGAVSSINTDVDPVSVNITAYGSTAEVEEDDGKTLFAGPRDDPFFFDLGAYQEILNGNAASFDDPGTDTFAGTNVLAIVFELSKDELGNSDVINAWVETKRRS